VVVRADSAHVFRARNMVRLFDHVRIRHNEARIASAWHQRRPTLETTLLSRGLGFKGWIREWDNPAERHRYWGSLLMRGPDMHRLFDQLQPGAMVVIF
jgi:hypothetical protein